MAARSDGDWERAQREIVAAVRSGRVTRREVARECGVLHWTVRDWVRREAARSVASKPRFVAVEQTRKIDPGEQARCRALRVAFHTSQLTGEESGWTLAQGEMW